MKKRVLMGLVLLALIGTSAVFAQTPTLDKLKFSKQTAGFAYVSATNKNISGAVVIPDTYDNLPVTKVYVNGFSDTTITSVIFPNSLTTFEGRAFWGCKGLTSITFPASVTTIANNAFENCNNLTSVTFLGSDPNTVTSSRSFDGDLQAKYKAGGAGTYTRSAGGTVWTKQGGVALCPYCGQPLPAGFKAP